MAVKKHLIKKKYIHTHASLLTFFVCLFVLFLSSSSHARVFGKTLLHESPISYRRCFLFSFFGAAKLNMPPGHCYMQYVLLRRWSQQRRLLVRDVTRRIQYWWTAIRWYISCILSRLFHLKKSKNSSYLALAYLPQRQRMNYASNRTLRLQIYWPLRGNWYNH